ncbi:MAG: hypothetical protein LBR13_05750 [Dysgonamonadaceae bacterium]|jgi:hypothetical protein|nr:hypothetical protein [Dysgonamonadaceae bacterium]
MKTKRKTKTFLTAIFIAFAAFISVQAQVATLNEGFESSISTTGNSYTDFQWDAYVNVTNTSPYFSKAPLVALCIPTFPPLFPYFKPHAQRRLLPATLFLNFQFLILNSQFLIPNS